VKKIFIFSLSSLYSIPSRHFVKHTDAEINAPQAGLAFCEILLISDKILSKFLSVLFWSRLKEIFRKAKIARSQQSIVHRGSSKFICYYVNPKREEYDVISAY